MISSRAFADDPAVLKSMLQEYRVAIAAALDLFWKGRAPFPPGDNGRLKVYHILREKYTICSMHTQQAVGVAAHFHRAGMRKIANLNDVAVTIRTDTRRFEFKDGAVRLHIATYADKDYAAITLADISFPPTSIKHVWLWDKDYEFYVTIAPGKD